MMTSIIIIPSWWCLFLGGVGWFIRQINRIDTTKTIHLHGGQMATDSGFRSTNLLSILLVVLMRLTCQLAFLSVHLHHAHTIVCVL